MLQDHSAATYFVGNFPGHVSLRPFDCAESLAEVELNVITFPFHAYPQQDTTLSIQIKPVLPGNEIAKMGGIQFEGCSTYAVMIPQRVPVPDSGNDI